MRKKEGKRKENHNKKGEYLQWKRKEHQQSTTPNKEISLPFQSQQKGATKSLDS